MNELLPVAAGVVAGALASAAGSARRRLLTLVLLCVAGGVAATVISGEYRTSWAFALLDTALVLLGAVGALLVVRLALLMAGRRPGAFAGRRRSS